MFMNWEHAVLRREFLKYSGTVPLALGGVSVFAQTQIAASRIATVSDGFLRLPGSFIFDPMLQEDLSVLRATCLSMPRS